uniref:Uncharacterized protein n=1 Tax=Timema bartmani TaxID=61472 RepID=A0A7R9F6M0_9NEOP|nr:unnamed protein product [Timema bartmani]
MTLMNSDLDTGTIKRECGLHPPSDVPKLTRGWTGHYWDSQPAAASSEHQESEATTNEESGGLSYSYILGKNTSDFDAHGSSVSTQVDFDISTDHE